MKNQKATLEVKRLGTLGWHLIDRSGPRIHAYRCDSKKEAIKRMEVRAFDLKNPGFALKLVK